MTGSTLEDWPESWGSITSKSGEFILTWEGQALSSQYNPRSEAQKYWEKHKIEGSDYLIWFGGGSFYHLIHYLSLPKPLPLVVIEPHKGLKQALLKVGQQHILEQILFLDSLDCLGALFEGYSFGIPHFLSSPLYKRVFPQFYSKLSQEIQERRNMNQVNRNTLYSHGPLWIQNIAKKIIHPLKGIQRWRNSFNQARALIFAAGPSLDPFLTQYHPENWDLIIAVDTAQRTLSAHGVKVDFWVSTDGQYWNSRHMDRAPEPRLGLLADVCSHPRISQLWPTKTYFCTSFNPFSQDLFSDQLGTLKSGGSVSTIAWEWAKYLGCEEIHIAGLDLSYPKGKTHARGSLHHRYFLDAETRVHPATTKAFELSLKGHLTKGSSYEGKEIDTDMRMKIYCRWFEYMLSQPSSPRSFVFNPSGLFIQGMQLSYGDKPANPKKEKKKPEAFQTNPASNFSPNFKQWFKFLKDIKQEDILLLYQNKSPLPAFVENSLLAFFPFLTWNPPLNEKSFQLLLEKHYPFFQFFREKICNKKYSLNL